MHIDLILQNVRLANRRRRAHPPSGRGRVVEEEQSLVRGGDGGGCAGAWGGEGVEREG